MFISKLSLILLISLLMFACSKEKYSSDEKKFIEIYKQILITRYTVTDSTLAAKQINKLLKNNGLNIRSFYELFWEIKKKDNQKFVEMMDTIHKMALNEVMSQRKKEIMQNK